MGVTGAADGGEQAGQMFGSARFDGHIDGRIAEADSVISAIEQKLDNVGALRGDHGGKFGERAGPIRQINTDSHEPPVFHQSSFDDAAQERNVDIPTANDHGGVLTVQ